MTRKTLAIIQSCYIPWKGYFDIIQAVDEFVLYDTCQFTRRDWRTRNRIKTPQGSSWLSVPVCNKGNFTAAINEVEVDGHAWVDKHKNSFRHHYARARHFKTVWPEVEAMYEACRDLTRLSEINHLLTRGICGLLGVDTPLVWATDEDSCAGDPSARLAEICVARGATVYLSGPAAKDYLRQEEFTSRGVEVAWMRYDQYPEYEQLHPPFEHSVTVLDMLFNVGPEAALPLLSRFRF